MSLKSPICTSTLGMRNSDDELLRQIIILKTILPYVGGNIGTDFCEMDLETISEKMTSCGIDVDIFLHNLKNTDGINQKIILNKLEHAIAVFPPLNERVTQDAKKRFIQNDSTSQKKRKTHQ